MAAMATPRSQTARTNGRRGKRSYIWLADINQEKAAKQVAQRLLGQLFDGSGRHGPFDR